MKSPKITKRTTSYKRAEILPFLCYIVMPLVFVFDQSNRLLFSLILCLIGFTVTTLISLIMNKKPPAEKGKTSKFTFFFGMIYVFVAGSAITTALSDFSQTTLSSMLLTDHVGTQQTQNILVFISYLATAITFFHGGITFLATDAADLLTKGKARLVLPHFTVIFSEAVILYFMATEINSLENFLKLTIALMTIDILWVISYHRNRDLVFIEWGHYNSMTLFFLFITLTTPYSLESFTLLVIVIVLRSICDYIIGWSSFYGKFPLQEM